MNLMRPLRIPKRMVLAAGLLAVFVYECTPQYRYVVVLGEKGTLSFYRKGWFWRDELRRIELAGKSWWWDSPDGWAPVSTPYVSHYNGLSDLVLESNDRIFFQSTTHPDTRQPLRIFYPDYEHSEVNVPLENRHSWWQIQVEDGEWQYYYPGEERAPESPDP